MTNQPLTSLLSSLKSSVHTTINQSPSPTMDKTKEHSEDTWDKIVEQKKVVGQIGRSLGKVDTVKLEQLLSNGGG